VTSSARSAIAAATSILRDTDRTIDQPRLAKLLFYAAVFTYWSVAGEHEAGAPWAPWWPTPTHALAKNTRSARQEPRPPHSLVVMHELPRIE